MLDLHIDCLQLHITNAAGHEHRLQSIALLALDLLALDLLAYRLDERQGSGQRTSIENLDAPAVSLDLNRMSDTEAAQSIAGAWLEALALKLSV